MGRFEGFGGQGKGKRRRWMRLKRKAGHAEQQQNRKDELYTGSTNERVVWTEWLETIIEAVRGLVGRSRIMKETLETRRDFGRFPRWGLCSETETFQLIGRVSLQMQMQMLDQPELGPKVPSTHAFGLWGNLLGHDSVPESGQTLPIWYQLGGGIASYYPRLGT